MSLRNERILIFSFLICIIMGMASALEDIVSRIQNFFAPQQQQLLNPVVDPEEFYISRLKDTFAKNGMQFGEKQQMEARRVFRSEMAAKQKQQSPQPRPTQSPWATPMPSMTPQPAVLGVSSIDPRTLPTYNNPKELERVKPYLQYIQKSAQTYGMPPELLAAALWRESAGFNPKYITGRHTDGTGRGIAGIDANQRADVPDTVAYDPSQAIDWMAKTLKGYQDAEGGNTYNALRRYNGGPSYNSDRIGYKGVPVRDLTKRHADYITANAQNLKPIFASPTPSPVVTTP